MVTAINKTAIECCRRFGSEMDSVSPAPGKTGRLPICLGLSIRSYEPETKFRQITSPAPRRFLRRNTGFAGSDLVEIPARAYTVGNVLLSLSQITAAITDSDESYLLMEAS